MAAAKKKYDEDIPPGHPSQDTTERFAVDELLRGSGFRILRRRRGEEPWWERWEGPELRWVAYPQSEAVRGVDWDALKDALYAEELYYDGLLGWD